jgi:hypothetical protein
LSMPRCSRSLRPKLLVPLIVRLSICYPDFTKVLHIVSAD